MDYNYISTNYVEKYSNYITYQIILNPKRIIIRKLDTRKYGAGILTIEKNIKYYKHIKNKKLDLEEILFKFIPESELNKKDSILELKISKGFIRTYKSLNLETIIVPNYPILSLNFFSSEKQVFYSLRKIKKNLFSKLNFKFKLNKLEYLRIKFENIKFSRKFNLNKLLKNIEIEYLSLINFLQLDTFQLNKLNIKKLLRLLNITSTNKNFIISYPKFKYLIVQGISAKNIYCNGLNEAAIYDIHNQDNNINLFLSNIKNLDIVVNLNLLNKLKLKNINKCFIDFTFKHGILRNDNSEEFNFEFYKVNNFNFNYEFYYLSELFNFVNQILKNWNNIKKIDIKKCRVSFYNDKLEEKIIDNILVKSFIHLKNKKKLQEEIAKIINDNIEFFIINDKRNSISNTQLIDYKMKERIKKIRKKLAILKI